VELRDGTVEVRVGLSGVGAKQIVFNKAGLKLVAVDWELGLIAKLGRMGEFPNEEELAVE
jgi:hypothetical protein